jgi:uncharacterized phage protein (TIGR01671 family)
MREIKFRGKDIDRNQWRYGSLVRVAENDGTLLDYIVDEQNQQWIVFPETVGQYIGLKDKNGKEIYESDVLIGSYGLKIVTPTVVKFGHGAFIVDSNNPDGYLYLADIIESLSWEVEVIGNIYEMEETK